MRPDKRRVQREDWSSVVGGSPEQLGVAVQSDIAKFAKVIKDVGIKSE